MKLPNTVINFHVIDDSVWMEKVLILLKRHYNMVGLDDLKGFYTQGKHLKNACHLTVDDGDMSVYNHLFPLIKKHNIPISIYVSPASTISGDNFWFQEISDYDKEILLNLFNKEFGLNFTYQNSRQFKALFKSVETKKIYDIIALYQKKMEIPKKQRKNMKVDQLIELHESGLVAIGAHTQTHPILSNETDSNAIVEIKDSITELSDILKTKVAHFAYPNGIPVLDFSRREKNILKGCQVDIAFSTENKRFSKKDDPLSIPRNGLTYGKMNFILTKLALGKEWDRLKSFYQGKQEKSFRKDFKELKN